MSAQYHIFEITGSESIWLASAETSYGACRELLKIMKEARQKQSALQEKREESLGPQPTEEGR